MPTSSNPYFSIPPGDRGDLSPGKGTMGLALNLGIELMGSGQAISLWNKGARSVRPSEGVELKGCCDGQKVRKNFYLLQRHSASIHELVRLNQLGEGFDVFGEVSVIGDGGNLGLNQGNCFFQSRGCFEWAQEVGHQKNFGMWDI